MSRLNLSQTCLLEVSGELHGPAQQKLHEQIAEFPAALLEYEVVRGQFDMLSMLPTFDAELSNAQCRAIRENIKRGIHDVLLQRKRQVIAQRRKRLLYRALSMVSAAAAVGVVAGSLFVLHQKVVRREARLRDAEVSLREVAQANFGVPINARYRRFADALARLERSANAPMATRDAGPGMMRFLDALDQAKVQQQNKPQPGPM